MNKINLFSKASIIILLALFSQIALAQGQAQKNIERQHKEVIDALNLGDCIKAQKKYNVLKTLAGKKYPQLEERIIDCKGIPAGYVDLGLPSGTLWRSNNESQFYDFDDALLKFGSTLPSKEQWEELMKYCKWRWVNGYYIVGPSGDSIYLFASGYRTCLGGYRSNFFEGCYWTSTTSIDNKTWAVDFGADRKEIFETNKCSGYYVCLVSKRKTSNQKTSNSKPSITLSNNSLDFDCNGGSTSISVTSNKPWHLGVKPASWISATISGNMIKIHVASNIITEERSDYFTVVSGNTEVKVVVAQEAAEPKQTIRSGYVDLGLPSGTLWKATNETNPNDSYNFYKYDEAVKKYGSKLPTKEQFEELANKCIWKISKPNKEIIAIGPNGYSIAIPITGYYNCLISNVFAEGAFAAFWAYNGIDSQFSWSMLISCLFSDIDINITSTAICNGMSVRLVKKK